MSPTPGNAHENLYRHLLEAAPDGIVVVDHDGRIVEANARICQLAQRDLADLLGSPVEILVPAPIAARHERLRKLYFGDPDTRTMAGGRVLSLRRADDSEIAVEISLSPVEVQGRRLTIAVLRDLTDLVGMERVLQRRTSELEQALTEISLKNTDLVRQAQELEGLREEAVNAARAKSLFLATISHEIRTPLNGVYGMLQLLQGGGLTGESREQVAAAAASAETLLGLVNDVLDWSRVEAQVIEVRRERFSLVALVEETLRLHSAAAHRKGLWIDSVLGPDAPDVVEGDAGHLRQVLSNVIGNAVKFTSVGSVSVAVEPAPDGMVHITVHDTGCGIDAAAVPLLFEPFVQVGTPAQSVGGSGLGLAIARRLLDAMGGSIVIRSTPGVGTTVDLRLPLRPAAADLAGVDGPSRPRAGAHVLLDGLAPVTAAAIRSRLERIGVVVTNQLAGVRTLSGTSSPTAPFDLVIADGEQRAGDGRHRATLPVAPRLGICRLGVGMPAGDGPSMSAPVVSSELLGVCATVMASSPPMASSDRPSPSADAPRRFTGRRLLVVDDDHSSRLLAAMLLRRLGAEVLTASDGSEAVGLLARRELVDMVLMDCRMPGMDGYSATHLIRQHLGLVTPVIAVTASLSEAEQRRCRDSGMQAVVAKPLRLDVLERVIEAWLDKPIAPVVDTAPPRDGAPHIP